MIIDFGSCRKKEQDLFNAMGSMYAAVLFIGIQNASSVQAVVAIERTVFYRERAAGMYSTFPYAFGQVKTRKTNFFSICLWPHLFPKVKLVGSGLSLFYYLLFNTLHSYIVSISYNPTHET